jgi:hypothetical protein
MIIPLSTFDLNENINSEPICQVSITLWIIRNVITNTNQTNLKPVIYLRKTWLRRKLESTNSKLSSNFITYFLRYNIDATDYSRNGSALNKTNEVLETGIK